MATNKKTPCRMLVDFAVGLALLVSLCPMGDKLPEKPAGFRTAIELLDKRISSAKGGLVEPAVVRAA